MLKDIEKYLRWKIGAREDDAIQEGLIAAWNAMENHPGKDKPYYMKSAYRGAQAYLRGDKTTGNPRNRTGTPKLVGVDDEFWPDLFRDTELDIDTRIVVRDAIAELTPDQQRYIIYRFVMGDPERVAARQAGFSHQEWHRNIKPKLRRSLAGAIGN